MDLTHENALAIAKSPDENLDVRAQKSEKSGKFAALLFHSKNGKLFEMLLSSDPTFETPEQAEGCMREVIQMFRKMNKTVLKGKGIR